MSITSARPRFQRLSKLRLDINSTGTLQMRRWKSPSSSAESLTPSSASLLLFRQFTGNSSPLSACSLDRAFSDDLSMEESPEFQRGESAEEHIFAILSAAGGATALALQVLEPQKEESRIPEIPQQKLESPLNESIASMHEIVKDALKAFFPELDLSSDDLLELVRLIQKNDVSQIAAKCKVELTDEQLQKMKSELLKRINAAAGWEITPEQFNTLLGVFTNDLSPAELFKDALKTPDVGNFLEEFANSHLQAVLEHLKVPKDIAQFITFQNLQLCAEILSQEKPAEPLTKDELEKLCADLSERYGSQTSREVFEILCAVSSGKLDIAPLLKETNQLAMKELFKQAKLPTELVDFLFSEKSGTLSLLDTAKETLKKELEAGCAKKIASQLCKFIPGGTFVKAGIELFTTLGSESISTFVWQNVGNEAFIQLKVQLLDETQLRIFEKQFEISENSLNNDGFHKIRMLCENRDQLHRDPQVLGDLIEKHADPKLAAVYNDLLQWDETSLTFRSDLAKKNFILNESQFLELENLLSDKEHRFENALKIIRLLFSGLNALPPAHMAVLEDVFSHEHFDDLQASTQELFFRLIENREVLPKGSLSQQTIDALTTSQMITPKTEAPDAMKTTISHAVSFVGKGTLGALLVGTGGLAAPVLAWAGDKVVDVIAPPITELICNTIKEFI